MVLTGKNQYHAYNVPLNQTRRQDLTLDARYDIELQSSQRPFRANRHSEQGFFPPCEMKRTPLLFNGSLNHIQKFCQLFPQTRSHKIAEQRVGPQGAGFEFRVKLHAHEPGVIFELNYLDNSLVRRSANDFQAKVY